MALRGKAFGKKAEKFGSKELEEITSNREQLFVLDKLLNDAYTICRPRPSDYEDRRQVIRVFNEIAKELYGNNASCPVVEEFGSFSMDLFTTGSDLDLSVNFRNSYTEFPRYKKIKTLWKFARKFYSLQTGGYFQGVEPIMSAMIPILKVVDSGTGIECDLSVENRDGISKSAMIRFITSIDERFLKLCFLMKAWAKAHDINSAKDRTLNSLSIILLVALHLQTREPAILPPFSAILRGGHDLVSVQNAVRNFQNYGWKNTETLGELFVSFFLELSSVENLWRKGLCASPYQGHWISKTWDMKIANMNVEDFMDQTQNVARAVGEFEVTYIYTCIHRTIKNLRSFMNGQIEASLLNETLFGIDREHHNPFVLQPSMYKENKNRHVMTANPVLVMNKVSISNRYANDPKFVKEIPKKNEVIQDNDFRQGWNKAADTQVGLQLSRSKGRFLYPPKKIAHGAGSSSTQIKTSNASNILDRMGMLKENVGADLKNGKQVQKNENTMGVPSLYTQFMLNNYDDDWEEPDIEEEVSEMEALMMGMLKENVGADLKNGKQVQKNENTMGVPSLYTQFMLNNYDDVEEEVSEMEAFMRIAHGAGSSSTQIKASNASNILDRMGMLKENVEADLKNGKQVQKNENTMGVPSLYTQFMLNNYDDDWEEPDIEEEVSEMEAFMSDLFFFSD